MSENRVEQVELLSSDNDSYGGVVVKIEQSIDSKIFPSSLRASISQWRQQGKKGVWIKLPIEHANLVEATVKVQAVLRRKLFAVSTRNILPQKPIPTLTSAMALAQGKWVKLDQNGTGPGARSSHAISIVGQKAYVFGGEFSPRVPVDNKVHVFDLETLTWSVANATGDVPPPRVGVTMAAVGKTIYVFGGRDSEHNELNELYKFDTSTSKWTQLSDGPDHRSYHSTTADDRHVYIFGGCGVAGRLNDLWAYDVVDQKWIKYPNPGDKIRGRGGPGLAVAQGKIWVVYGFAGEEVDDVHYFDPAREEWAQVETTGEKPTARSVFSTVGIGKYIFIHGGEVDPSDLGHLGAGKFANEVYTLDTETLVWKRWEDGPDSGDHPGPRGWTAFAGSHRHGKEGLLVYGGNSPSNDRLGDIFFFTPYL